MRKTRLIAARSMAVVGVLIIALAAFVGVAVAQEESYLDGKVRFGDEVRITSGETVDSDLYVFAGSVVIDGTVNGDVLAFAGSLDVNGTVTGDVHAGTGQVTVRGSIGGDLRVGTGRLSVSGPVGEDVLAGAGAVTISSKVGQDLIFGSGTMDLTGEVVGDVLGSAGAYTNTGAIGGSEDVRIEQPDPDDRSNPVVRTLQRYVSVILIALLAGWLLRGFVTDAAERIRSDWLRSLGFGILVAVALIVAPIVALLVGILLTIVFALLGLFELVGLSVLLMVLVFVFVGSTFFLVGTFLAPIIVGLVLGTLIITNAPEGFGGWFLRVAVGAAIVVIVTAVPVIGWLLGFVVTAATLGAVVLRYRRPAPGYLESDEAALGLEGPITE